MLIRNLDCDNTNYYKCKKHIANYLLNKGFIQIGLENEMYIFKSTPQLHAVLKIMPLHLKIMAKLGGDNSGRQ